jgi:hypothetical protein
MRRQILTAGLVLLIKGVRNTTDVAGFVSRRLQPS